MFRKIADKFKSGKKTIIWEKDYGEDKPDREMIYRFPNKNITEFGKLENIGVRDYERVLYYRSGQSGGVLTGGHYQIQREARNLATEIVWIDPGIIKQKFGISWKGGMVPRTDDGFALGGSGDLSIRIQDPEALVTKVVVGQPNFTDKDAKELVRSLVTTSFRDVVKLFTLDKFLRSDREQFISLLRTKTAEEFKIYGLELISANILDIAHPPDDERLVRQIMESTRDDIESLIKEQKELEEMVTKYKRSISDLEDKWAMGEIKDDEFEEKSARMKKIKEKRETELDEIKKKITSKT